MKSSTKLRHLVLNQRNPVQFCKKFELDTVLDHRTEQNICVWDWLEFAGESPEEYEYFLTHRDSGFSRSLKQTSINLGMSGEKGYSKLYLIKDKWSWDARIARYEAWMTREESRQLGDIKSRIVHTQHSNLLKLAQLNDEILSGRVADVSQNHVIATLALTGQADTLSQANNMHKTLLGEKLAVEQRTDIRMAVAVLEKPGTIEL